MKDFKTGITVREIMSTNIVTVGENETISSVAKLMKEHNIGSVIIVDSGNNPVGIITERDIITRVLAKDLHPAEVKIKEVMSVPLRTIGPSLDISDAASLMRKHRIRRLVVMEGGKMVGIITDRNIFSIMPELLYTAAEKLKMEEITEEYAPLVGYCDDCGQWSDILKEIEGRFLCEDCIRKTREEVL